MASATNLCPILFQSLQAENCVYASNAQVVFLGKLSQGELKRVFQV